MSCEFGVVFAPTSAPGSAAKTRPIDVGTKLVVARDQPTVYTANQETDARVALSRAVAEYLAPLEFRPLGGRLVRFETAVYEWAVPEVGPAVYPALCVYASGPQEYDASGFTTHVGVSAKTTLPDDKYIVHTSNLTVRLMVQAYASDPEERSAIVAGLESAISPVIWMSGFRLDMPHYFGARATFSQVSADYQDSAEDSQRRWRRATVVLEARGPVMRLARLPKSTYKTDTEVSQGA